jgi:hypothetical protein
VVGGDKDGELLYMALWSLLFCLKIKHRPKKEKHVTEKESEVHVEK